jgi:hypothetical protein
LTAPGEISIHACHGASEAFQCLGADDELNPENSSETPKVLKEMDFS